MSDSSAQVDLFADDGSWRWYVAIHADGIKSVRDGRAATFKEAASRIAVALREAEEMRVWKRAEGEKNT